MQHVSSDINKAVDPKGNEPKKATSAEAKDAKLVKKTYDRYVRARDRGHEQYMKDAAKSDRYYRGEQWDEADKQKLEAEGRPALTINMIRSTINAVLKEQSTTRADVKFKNRRGGSEETANALSKLYLIDSDYNRLEWVESQVFADGIIEDRGWYDVRVEFDDNLMGQVKIKADDNRNIIIDPDAKEYDPRTWTEIFETKWMSLEEVELTYGKEKRVEIEAFVSAGTAFDRDSVRFQDENKYGDIDSATNAAQTHIEDGDDRNIRVVRIVERQYYKLAPCFYFVDVETGDTKKVPQSWDEERRDTFAHQMQLEIYKRMDRKVRWSTIAADKVLLHDEWSPYDSFTKVPFFPQFRRGNPMGMVKDLISPQDQLNKVESQQLHVVNTTANSGWEFESGSLINMTADDLRAQGAQTGLVLEFAPGKQAPKKIESNQIPTGLDRMGQKAANNISIISGINKSMLGQDSPELSGVALEKNKTSGQAQVQIPLDNLAYSRRLLTEKMLELWQQFYTEGRILLVTNDMSNEPDEEVGINQVDEVGNVFNDITVGKYEVMIGSQPARDTFEDSQFAEALALRSAGVEIPDDRIVEYSNLARKAELAQEIRDMTGRGEISEEQQAMQEFQQQIEQQLMVGQVQKAEADVALANANAALAMAKAEKSAGGIDSPEFQLEREKLDFQIQKTREELQLRMRLAELGAMNKLDIGSMGARNKLSIKQMDNNKREQDMAMKERMDNKKQARDARAKMGNTLTMGGG